MLRVILLRHGETAYNAEGNRYCGRTDISLTGKGLAQAERVFAAVRNVRIDAVYSSPLKRAMMTADRASGNRPVKVDQRLIEADFGKWEGMTREQFIAEDPLLWEQWLYDPSKARAGGTGETGSEIVERINDFFMEMRVRHVNEIIMVVGHNGTNRLFLASKLGMPLSKYRCIEQENASLTFFELDNDNNLNLKRLNSNTIF